MLTRKLANHTTALIAGLVAGLAGQTAAATDTVVAYGDAAAKQAREVDAVFQARMLENARNLDRAIRANVEREVTRIKAPAIRVALTEVAKRG